MAKCDRVLKYINGTRELGIRLRGTENMGVRASIDTSHGVHPNGRSHTGLHESVGVGPINVKSCKMGINTKSSTESELVGSSDEISPAIGHANFLEQQGYPKQPVLLYQDNQSTIRLIMKGKSTSDSTRHINLRYFFVHDLLSKGEVKVEYKPTKEMIADILTKPLQGTLFLDLRKMLMGHN
jgi:hypothetical protein